MIRAQRLAGEAVDWALADEEIGPAGMVLPLDEVIVDPDGTRRPYCPACGDREPMHVAVTAGGVRYDLCTGCGLLWHVDHERRLVTGSRAVAPRSPPGT